MSTSRTRLAGRLWSASLCKSLGKVLTLCSQHMASAYGATPIASLLLEKGADPDVQDNMGLTALHMSAGYVRPTTTKLLIENGAVRAFLLSFSALSLLLSLLLLLLLLV